MLDLPGSNDPASRARGRICDGDEAGAKPAPPARTGCGDKRLRILLTGYRSHPHVGGQGVYLYELSRALLELGHEVHVVSGPPYPELDPRVMLHRLASLDLFSRSNAVLAFHPRFLTRHADLAEWALHNTGAFGEPLAFAMRLKQWLASRPGRYDVIHDNQGLAGPMLDAARAGKAALTATLHHPITIDLEYALAAAGSAWKRALVRRWHGFVPAQGHTARALSALLTVSCASKDRAVRDFDLDPNAIVVAPNGIDHDIFTPRPATPREPGLIVATASADVPIKGVDVLMDGFARLADQRPNARLTLIGRLRDGAAKERLAASGHADRVTCVADLSRTDVADLYRRAHVVVSPARFEGFGFPAAEAMACAAPVIASDGGALPEVVGDAGVLFPSGDGAALSAALDALLSDPGRAQALGAQGQARAKARFSWRAHAEAALEVYARVGAC